MKHIYNPKDMEILLKYICIYSKGHRDSYKIYVPKDMEILLKYIYIPKDTEILIKFINSKKYDDQFSIQNISSARHGVLINNMNSKGCYRPGRVAAAE